MNEDLVVRAPELPQDFVWLNTPRPLSLRELRGQLVLLDFWTYCCINCMHVLPVLDQLEERHRHDPVVVIGVHSAKFEGERDPERIRDAIARYGIRHPVLVDREMRVWNEFAVRSWPTLVAVRPDGTIGAVAPGEPDPAVLSRFVTQELDRARQRGVLASQPFKVERIESRPELPLSFPGKIALAPDGRIAVSDSGHHRVLVCDANGGVISAIGRGTAGHVDGAFDTAELEDPQGVCFDPTGKLLFIADARNHTILRADLDGKKVETIAGTGHLGATPLSGETPARTTKLRSPWDLAFSRGRRPEDTGDVLYIAMAGSHQICALDLDRGNISVVAGTGAESIVDGPFEEATFSQPSGLALSGNELWVADSETSSVRVLDFHRRTVRTLVGVGLFDFGDEDGPPSIARLQHCLGITLMGTVPIVADTYNHKLKQVDPRTGDTILLFRGADGLILREPGGVAWDPVGRRFLVADTGHSRVVEVSPDGGRARVLDISGAPSRPTRRVRAVTEPTPPSRATSWFTAVLSESPPIGVGDATIELALRPQGQDLHLANRSQVKLAIEVSRRSDLLVPSSTAILADVDDVDRAVVRIPVNVKALPSDSIASEMLVTIECIACSDGGLGTPAACIPLRSYVRLPIRLATSGGSTATFEIPVGDPG
jgi:DNA-binding beta-propeller fold protein YncE